MRIKTDDMVEVISGADRGTRGRVLRVERRAGKLVVEGVNEVQKHVRPSQKNPQGGRLTKEMPIQASNVLLVCSQCNAATRAGARIESDGSKVRYCKKCGAANGTIASPKDQDARK